MSISGFRYASVNLATPTPTLIQGVSWGANPVNKGISGNNFLGTLPNPVGAGNAIIINMTYPHGSTPTVSDNNGNTWSSAVVTADNGVGNYVSSTFVLLNANSGITTFQTSFGASVIPFQWEIWEFKNIATANALNGTTSSAGVSGSSLACGSFTPTTNNDSNGGNLVLSYYGLASLANGTSRPTDFVPGTGFNLLEGNIAWFANDGFWHSSSYNLQRNQAAINPSMTATSDTNVYNCIAIALKAANTGTSRSAGIKIIRICHYSVPFVSSTGTYQFKCPSDGNLRVLANAAGVTQITIGSTAVTDSESNTWTMEQPTNNSCPYFFFAPNTSPNNNLTVSVPFTGKIGAGMSFRYWDIIGASASPFDTAVGFPDTAENSVTTVNNCPSITPGISNGLMLASSGAGQGPVTFATGVPAAAIFDSAQYTGITDIDLMDNADGIAHYYNPNTTQVNWNWTIPSTTNDIATTAIVFKPA